MTIFVFRTTPEGPLYRGGAGYQFKLAAASRDDAWVALEDQIDRGSPITFADPVGGGECIRLSTTKLEHWTLFSQTDYFDDDNPAPPRPTARLWEMSVTGIASETVMVMARSRADAERKALQAAEDLVVNGSSISWEVAGEV